MTYLLDTNIISECQRRHPDPGVVEWLRSTPGHHLFLSVLVVGELRRGVEALRRRDPVGAEAPRLWLRDLVTTFSDRLLPVSAAVAEEWGRLGIPDRLPAVDSLIAATARVHGLTVVTRNVKDFERAGVPLLNPFRS
ncbi:MAG: toxin FitB [Actinomycetota bacterium]|nr:toxin FitB [Actinomycetota bacterium]